MALSSGSEMTAEHAKRITWVYDLAAGGRRAGRPRKQEEEDLLSINRGKCVHEYMCPCLCGKTKHKPAETAL